MQSDSHDKQSSEKQTLSFLLRRFQQAGIEPRTDLGQNFMIDMNLQRVLLEAAHIGPDDVVLEVGTGTGGLTTQMAPLAAAVISVEVDRDLHQLAGEELYQFTNVTLLHTDVLAAKSRIEPAVLAAVQRELDVSPQRRFKLVANLPYNIATPLVSNLLALDRPPGTMTITVQKEVADRMVARPGVKEYAALAIWIQSQCRAEIVRVLPPSVFWPRPKVSSAFVQITLEETLRERHFPGGMADRAFFHEFVRALFCHRRKILRSELLSSQKQCNARNPLNKAQIDELLACQGLDPTLRAERLTIEEMLRLCEAVRTATAS
jgi:16S rRNA (adenine1518-N6/adenine1519-N6)-dimethyltransferase